MPYFEQVWLADHGFRADDIEDGVLVDFVRHFREVETWLWSWSAIIRGCMI